MNLKDKLNIYQKKPAEIQKELPTKEFTPEAIGAEKIITECGPVWRIEQRLQQHDALYSVRLNDFMCDITPLLRYNKFPLDIQIEDLLFFDLETTSLSMGAGNYPFLIGIGYTDGDDFITEQLFMENYNDEIAMLHYLLPFFEKARGIVTFNGKSFDIPLIKNRYMLQRVYGFPVHIPVLDLIIPARRIFKSLFENCALQTLEKHVIGFERQGDIPGWMIPEVYFSFQKEGEWERIPSVIEHNRIDIISMCMLLYIEADIFRMVEKKQFSELHQESLFNLARHLYNVDLSSFLDLMEYLGEDVIGNESVFKKFSITLKRQKEWQQALSYWEKAGSLFALQELAKYYEHQEKNYQKALTFCEQAFDLLRNNHYSPQEPSLPQAKAAAFQLEFTKRKERLLKKADRS